jgi:hypothetical protein
MTTVGLLTHLEPIYLPDTVGRPAADDRGAWFEWFAPFRREFNPVDIPRRPSCRLKRPNQSACRLLL